MGRLTAVIAPILDDALDVPLTARNPYLRCNRLSSVVEQFFDPYDNQSFVFDTGWQDNPGVARLSAKATKEFGTLTQSWTDWTIANPAFGVDYPFFAKVFKRLGINPVFELPVWPVANENLGRYVHRFLTAATAGIQNLTYSNRDARPPGVGRPTPPIVGRTLELAQLCLEGVADEGELRHAHREWIRMGVVRNAFHKPGFATLHGQGVDGVEVRLNVMTRVTRFWEKAEFDCRLKAGSEARLIFGPPLRTVYLRYLQAHGVDRSWPLAIRAGGAATIENFDDEVQVFVPYSDAGYAQFVVPPDQTVSRISFDFQIRDDPAAQLAILEGVTRGRR